MSLYEGVGVDSLLLWVSVGVAPVVFLLLLVGYFRYIKQSRECKSPHKLLPQLRKHPDVLVQW